MSTITQFLYRQLRATIRHLCEGRQEYDRLQTAMTQLIQQTTTGRNIHTLLDVGCGQGGYTVNNARLIGLSEQNIYGIEFNPTHLAIAKERLAVFSIDLERDVFPLKTTSIDLVICNQVLEHIKNIFWLLSEIDRVLTVGGIMAIGIPNLTSLINRPVLLTGRQPVTIGIAGPHVRAFAHTSFRDFLSRHPGYTVISEIGSSLYPWPAQLGAERLARKSPSLSAYTFYALEKRQMITPCPWLQFGTDGETSYVHAQEGS